MRCRGRSWCIVMNNIAQAIIKSLINELYDKWGCDPMYYVNDTAEGKQARLDAAIIEWLEMHLDD